MSLNAVKNVSSANFIKSSAVLNPFIKNRRFGGALAGLREAFASAIFRCSTLSTVIGATEHWMEPLGIVGLSDLLALELPRIGVKLPMRPLPRIEECHAPSDPSWLPK